MKFPSLPFSVNIFNSSCDRGASGLIGEKSKSLLKVQMVDVTPSPKSEVPAERLNCFFNSADVANSSIDEFE